TTRKKMTEEYCQQALQIIHQEKLEQDSVLLVYLPECHESIAGIIAGRIKEIFHKPAFVVTKSGELAKGSGRSIEAYSMYDEMVKVKDCFLKFGGHKLAAGMSLEVERVQELRRRLNENSSLTEEDFKEKIKIDVPMPMSYVTQELMEQFSKLEPFGKANPKPLFAEKNLTLKQYRVLGEKQNVVQVVLKSPQGIYSDCIFFGNVPDFVEFCKRKESSRESINVTYQPHDNEYHGRHKKQMIIRNYA
ncbi:MAG: DHHA1 domain-containing protein, partial [Lachnospiraceae bacterium]